MLLPAKNSYPLDGKCLTKCVVYKATVTETDTKKPETYIGLTNNEFKTDSAYISHHLSWNTKEPLQLLVTTFGN